MTTADQNYEGCWLSDVISEKRLALATSFQPRPGDIFIVSYPKSGTTWLTSLIYHLLEGEHPAADSTIFAIPLMATVPWLENSPVEDLDAPAQASRARRVLKSHLPFKVMPSVGERRTDKSVKCIYIARNPKDVAVSFFHHYCLFKIYDYNGDWPNFFGKFINGELEFRSWFDHVQSWWEHRNDENILFLMYEDMQKDTKKCAELIASFLGISASARAIDTAVEQSTFKKLKAMDISKKILPDPDREEDFATNELEGQGFIRKGVVGNWKDYFTAEQSAEVDKLYAQLQTKCPGLEFTFEQQ